MLRVLCVLLMFAAAWPINASTENFFLEDISEFSWQHVIFGKSENCEIFLTYYDSPEQIPPTPHASNLLHVRRQCKNNANEELLLVEAALKLIFEQSDLDRRISDVAWGPLSQKRSEQFVQYLGETLFDEGRKYDVSNESLVTWLRDSQVLEDIEGMFQRNGVCLSLGSLEKIQRTNPSTLRKSGFQAESVAPFMKIETVTVPYNADVSFSATACPQE